MTATLLSREACRHYIEQELFTPKKYASDEKDGAIGLAGVELETFPFRMPDGIHNNIRPIPLYEGADCLMNVLLPVANGQGGVASSRHSANVADGTDAQPDCIAFPDGDCYFFEPGGQLEISTAPCDSIETLEQNLINKQNILKQLSETSGIQFAQYGMSPWWDAGAINNQLRWPRYQALESYLNSIGPFGREMMMDTCSLHINLNLGHSKETRAKRIIAANLLAPFASAIFAHSAVSGRKESGHQSYRSHIWRNLDQSRTGILPIDRIENNISEEALIDLYLEFALKAPLIYIPDLGTQVLPRNITFEYWLKHSIAGKQPQIRHLANHVSLLFPEVRPKGYLELRSIDVPPPQWQMAPVIFYAGLLYDEGALNDVLQLLLPLAPLIHELLERASQGLEPDDIFDRSKTIMRLAIDGANRLPRRFLRDQDLKRLIDFSEQFTMRRKTPADEQLRTFRNGGFSHSNLRVQ